MKIRKRYLFFVIVAGLTVCVAYASASTLTLPPETTLIDEEAFYGDTSLDEVIIPEGVEIIGAKAFAESSVKSITFPESLNTIGEGAFDGTNIQTVNAPEGSYAKQWVASHKLIHPNDPSDFTYRIEENSENIISKIIDCQTKLEAMITAVNALTD